MASLKHRALFLLAGILLVFGPLVFAGPKTLKEGDTFPELATFKLEGKLPDSLKGKIVIVDFWASWCLPCAESFPVLEELHTKYKDRVVIIGISVDEKAANMEKFLKKRPVNFLTVRDAEHKLVEAVSVPTMPSSFVLDGRGKVRFTHAGFHGKDSKKKFIEQLETLLKEKS